MSAAGTPLSANGGSGAGGAAPAPNWRVTPSVTAWVAFLESKSEEDIQAEVIYAGPDGARWTALFGSGYESYDVADGLAFWGRTLPGAQLDDHTRWNAELAGFAASSAAIGWSMLFLIALATLAIIVFATQAGLRTHREIVEVVHMIGARDVFIAKEFQGHFLWLGIRGGIIGLVMESVAKEMVAIGVLNSCVILLIKSVFISDTFFCLKMT